MSLFPKEHKANAWNEFLTFLWEGGFRSLIVFTFIIGALLITYNNQDICKPLPTSTGENALLVENPVCSKYLELVYLIVGGYLGLSLPSTPKDKESSPQANQDPETEKDNPEP